MSLTEELNNFREEFLKTAPKEVVSEMNKAQEELLKNEVGKKALGAGDTFPDFKLNNSLGKEVSFKDLVSQNKYLIISFYRGGWCPYCNLELKALQNELETFKSLGAELVAITPEKPDHSLTTSEKNDLSFQVLSDVGSMLAQKLNISFELPENLKPLYAQFGIEVDKRNGDFSLPIPSTFIVSHEGEIIFRFLDLDYTKRLDPKEIVRFLSE